MIKHRALKQRLQLLAFSGSSALFMHLKTPFQVVKDLIVKEQHFALVTEQNMEQSQIFAMKLANLGHFLTVMQEQI